MNNLKDEILTRENICLEKLRTFFGSDVIIFSMLITYLKHTVQISVPGTTFIFRLANFSER